MKRVYENVVLVGMSATITPEQQKWLQAQPEGTSAYIRRLIDQDRQRRPDLTQDKIEDCPICGREVAQ